jgi:hypothetical protein
LDEKTSHSEIGLGLGVLNESTTSQQDDEVFQKKKKSYHTRVYEIRPEP